MTALVCVCGCPQGRHLLDRRDCRSCRDCTAFEVDNFAVAPVVEPKRRAAKPATVAAGPVDVAALLGEVQGDVSRERELVDRLAEAERDRDRLDRALRNVAEERDALRGERDMAQAKLDSALLQMAAEVGRLTGENRDLSELIPCGWCDGLGIAPGERFGRDADGAPNVDEDRPCPEGCEIPAWLRAERNDAADNERELADAKRQISDLYKNEEIRARLLRERSVEIASLRDRLKQAEEYARDLQDQLPAGERLYDTHVRYLCAVCGGRYREFYPTHPCGRLLPVRVRITFIEEHHAA
jgi:hypothetical protein